MKQNLQALHLGSQTLAVKHLPMIANMIDDLWRNCGVGVVTNRGDNAEIAWKHSGEP
jgi:hypothetical protein